MVCQTECALGCYTGRAMLRVVVVVESIERRRCKVHREGPMARSLVMGMRAAPATHVEREEEGFDDGDEEE